MWAGIPFDRFWRMTPGEILWEAWGFAQRRNDELRRLSMLVFYIQGTASKRPKQPDALYREWTEGPKKVQDTMSDEDKFKELMRRINRQKSKEAMEEEDARHMLDVGTG